MAGTSDAALRERARRVIPGGMYGHQRAGLFPENFPQYLSHGEGALIRDVDGREFVDLLCGYGPIVLGYQHPVVEAAAAAQRRQADCQNAPSARMVELAELLVDVVDHADWAYLAKNGTDATTTCLTIARAATGRSVVLVARGSYHGAAPWCTPGLAGVLPSDRAALRYFEYNDHASLRAAVDEAGDDLAGIIVTPFKHNDGEDQELVDPAFARELRQVCDSRNAVLILDDVRCGFRLNFGGSWESLGIQPDLSAWGKAVSNGYTVSAILGIEALRDAATSIFSTGTYWFAAVPMAAAIATINAIRDEDGIAAMERAGQLLRSGIVEQARANDLAISYTGPAQMPYFRFLADTDFERMMHFSRVALDNGVYIHPRHNWFVSVAHTDEIVARALAGTEAAFRAVRDRFGDG
ncbi:aminotransferase class III-fold pyridoxal phosphate-dependent enzyme [Nonomuraea wenchangensis]|uniref:aminotransferase class III-fold pyridoxal phosphate-dependent enzyme n=1 Tax=Nonomuraea wenchangensis TaxID=568860 RepID=UPI00384C293A